MVETRQIYERVTSLEVQISNMSQDLAESNKKLDELLALRNKGVGAFWIISSLAGAGVIGLITMVMDWMKNLGH